jgi:hypothetical protein
MGAEVRWWHEGQPPLASGVIGLGSSARTRACRLSLYALLSLAAGTPP